MLHRADQSGSGARTICDVADGIWSERNEVWVAIHETHPATVLDHEWLVTHQQHTAPLGACRPVKHLETFEVAASANQ